MDEMIREEEDLRQAVALREAQASTALSVGLSARNTAPPMASVSADEPTSVAAALRLLPLNTSNGFPTDGCCCICYDPSDDNMSMCTSGHNACRTCALNTVRDRTTCPVCRVPFTKRPDGSVHLVSNKVLNNLITDMHIACPHSKCSFNCTVFKMPTHVGTCTHKPVDCTVPGCRWHGTRGELQDHLSNVDHSHLLVQSLLAVTSKVEGAIKEIGEIKTSIKDVKETVSTEFEKLRQQLTREVKTSHDTLLQQACTARISILDRIDQRSIALPGVVVTLQHQTQQLQEIATTQRNPVAPAPSDRTARRHRQHGREATDARQELEEASKKLKLYETRFGPLEAANPDDDVGDGVLQQD